MLFGDVQTQRCQVREHGVAFWTRFRFCVATPLVLFHMQRVLGLGVKHEFALSAVRVLFTVSAVVAFNRFNCSRVGAERLTAVVMLYMRLYVHIIIATHSTTRTLVNGDFCGLVLGPRMDVIFDYITGCEVAILSGALKKRIAVTANQVPHLCQLFFEGGATFGANE